MTDEIIKRARQKQRGSCLLCVEDMTKLCDALTIAVEALTYMAEGGQGSPRTALADIQRALKGKKPKAQSVGKEGGE